MGLSGENWRDLLIGLGLFALAIAGAIFHARTEWRAARRRLFLSHPEMDKAMGPGRIAERLSSGRWASVFGKTMGQALDDLCGEAGIPVAVIDAIRREEAGLRSAADALAESALKDGAVHSRLIRFDEALVYLLACPARPEDRRTFRSLPGLRSGWPSHLARVRRSATSQGESKPLVALAYFLGIDAREGALLVGYEADSGAGFAPELADLAAVPSGEPALTYPLSLA